MKCIYCGTDNKYKDRQDGHCSLCGKRFAFEPKKGDKLTDTAFKHAIEAVSANGRVRWGVENLYYEVARRLRKRGSKKALVVIGVIGGVAAVFLQSWAPVILAGFVLICIGVVYLFTDREHVRLDQPTFDSMWNRWIEMHGLPEGVIQRVPQPKRKAPIEPDIADYSFDRAVICDRARTVDLLLANNFHFENNCAVLSVGGYPEGPFETVRKMLKRNPKLQVFTLHDATPAGCKLAARLSTDPEWFKDQGRVVDVGLRPKHAAPFRGLYLPAAAATAMAASEGLGADEVNWLRHNALEIAAIRPEQLLKRLFRAINNKATETSDDGGSHGMVFFDDHSFSSDASDSDGGTDSFG